jgi:hypothetical protein
LTRKINTHRDDDEKVLRKEIYDISYHR